MTTSSESVPATSVPATALGSTPDARVPRAKKRVIFGLLLGNVALWLAFFTPIILSMQLKVQVLAPHNTTTALSLVLGITSIFGIVANPIAGRLSDRTLSRFGRRRPWILGSMVVGLVGLVLEGTATNLLVFGLGASLAAIGFSSGLAALLSLIPDQIPDSQRGGVAGLFGVGQAVATIVGIVVSGALSTTPVAAFVVPGVIALVFVILLCVLVPDRPFARADLPPFEWSKFLVLWTSPRKHPDFGWVWFSRFFIFLAFASVLNYQVFFIQGQLHVAAADTAKLVGLGTGVETVVLVITSVIAGRLSDRFSRRKPFVLIAAAIGAVGLIILAVSTVVPLFLLALAIVGFAQGIYYSVDLALVAQVLPDQKNDAAKDLGVFNIAGQLPQTFAPAVAPAFLAIGIGSVVAGPNNFTALFIGSAVFAAISAVTILRVRGAR